MRRYLASDGMFGAVPDWYPRQQAARYLGVPEWELEQQSIEYTNRALVAMDAEAKAAEDRKRRGQ